MMATMMSSSSLGEASELWTTELSFVADEIAKAASRLEKEWKGATKKSTK